MPIRKIVWTYDEHSSSARLLRAALQADRFPANLKKSAFNWIVCWGKAPEDIGDYGHIINHPCVVRRALNKARTFRYLEAAGVRTPRWTTKLAEATTLNQEVAVVCRRLLTGKDGEGITVVQRAIGNLSELDKLWTELIPKASEYRVHVVNGVVVDGMKKLRENGRAHSDIATTSNGYFFQKTGVITPENVKQEAVKALKALEMDFGGVDVVLGTDGNAYVLEVNSAPELGTNTVTPFATAIQAMVDQRRV